MAGPLDRAHPLPGKRGARRPSRARPLSSRPLSAAPLDPTRDSASLRREILRLAWPATVQNLLQTGMFLVDTTMIGALTKREGPGPLAAAGVCGPLLWSITVVFTVITVGTTAVVARATGEGDLAKRRSAVATSLVVASLLGIGVAAAGVLAAGPLVEWFARGNVTPAVRGMASGYLRYTLGAFPFAFVALAAMAAFRGAGDTATPLVATLGANAANVLGNWLLIYGNLGAPRLGVPGSGLATALATVGEAIFLLVALDRGVGGRLRVPLRAFREASRPMLATLARIAAPSGAEAVLYHAAFLRYQGAVFALGEGSIAAHRVAISLESLAFLPAYGFHIAAAAIAGQSLGARDPERAQRGVLHAVAIGTALMGLVSVAFLLAPTFLASLFASDPSLPRAVAPCLRIGAVEIPFLTATLVLSGGMRGAGETIRPFLATMVGAWACRVPLAFTLGAPGAWGLPGIWVATTLDWVVRAAILFALFRRGAWKRAVA